MNLWLIPASDDAADANIMKTLAVPISSERAKAAGVQVETRAWGAKASSDANVNKFKKMSPGDCCLFYTRRRGGGSKRYCWKGVISSTVQSSVLRCFSEIEHFWREHVRGLVDVHCCRVQEGCAAINTSQAPRRTIAPEENLCNVKHELSSRADRSEVERSR